MSRPPPKSTCMHLVFTELADSANKDKKHNITHTHTHTHTFNGPFSGTTYVSRYQKGKLIWILLKQETVSGSGISWAICKSATRSRQTTMPVPHHSQFFRGRVAFLPPNRQLQSTKGKKHNIVQLQNGIWLLCTFLHILPVKGSSQQLQW